MTAHRFLVVDDDPDLGTIVIEKLRALGDCTYCGSGHAAIKELDGGKFDVVITDYIMEGGDGGSLAHYCRNHKIPVLVVSSFPETQIRPYLPHGVSFANKFNAVRGTHLEDLVKSILLVPPR
ncbi:MAG: response regulator [Proteobacteria bacterium]|nr:MAG: response regulator [Pseudomonadota bacterium]